LRSVESVNSVGAVDYRNKMYVIDSSSDGILILYRGGRTPVMALPWMYLPWVLM
jgi:hypothetical protein